MTEMIAIYVVVSIATIAKMYCYHSIRGKWLFIGLVIPLFIAVIVPIWAFVLVFPNKEFSTGIKLKVSFSLLLDGVINYPENVSSLVEKMNTVITPFEKEMATRPKAKSSQQLYRVPAFCSSYTHNRLCAFW